MLRLFCIVLLVILSGSFSNAQSKRYTPHTDSSGIEYSLPTDWLVMSKEAADTLQGEEIGKIEQKLTNAERQSAAGMRRIFTIQKKGEESGGAVLGLQIENLPPSDQLTMDEVRSMTPFERVQMTEVFDEVGRHLAARQSELFGVRDSRFLGSRIVDTGRIVCFRMDFSGTHSSSLEARRVQFNCPAGPVALLIFVIYNHDLHDYFWPDIQHTIDSISIN